MIKTVLYNITTVVIIRKLSVVLTKGRVIKVFITDPRLDGFEHYEKYYNYKLLITVFPVQVLIRSSIANIIYDFKEEGKKL